MCISEYMCVYISDVYFSHDSIYIVIIRSKIYNKLTME